MQRAHAALLLTVAAAFVVGCGGGGGGSSTAPGSVPGHSSGGTTSNASFTIVVPPKTTTTQSGRRRPQFISPSTQSVAITVTAATQGSTSGTSSPAPVAAASSSVPTIANLTPTSPGCATTAAGLACSVSVGAPIGNDTFTMTFYDGLNATGNILSTGSTTATIAAGVPFAVSVVNGGVPSKVLVSEAASPAPVTGNVYLNVQAYDADNNLIVGTFASPLPVTASGAMPITLSTNALAVSTTQVEAQFSPSPPTSGTWTTGTVSIGSGSAVASVTFPLTNIQKYPIPLPAPTDVFVFNFTKSADGNSLWFPVENDFASNATSGGGTVSAGTSGEIVKLTFDGAMTTYALPAGSNPTELVLAGDGNLWFGNQILSGGSVFPQIESITPSGTITAQTVIAGLIETFGDELGTDPAGNVYYGVNSATGGTGIGAALVPGPSQTYWPAPQAPGSPLPTFFYPPGEAPPANPAPGAVEIAPGYLARGPDGNVWWIDQTWGFVGSIAPVGSSNAGAYTVYPVGPTSYGLNNFYALNDGSLWYTAVGAVFEDMPGVGTPGVVAHVATDGTVTEYPVPAQYFVVTARDGPNGSVYATAESAGGALLRIGTDGTVGVLPIKDNDNPVDLYYNASLGAFFYNEASGSELSVGKYTIAPGWHAFPENMTIDEIGKTRFIGIVESGNSGPFTVTSSNTAIASVAAGVAVPTVTDYVVTGNAPGTATITIQDAHGRIETANVTVTQTTGTISSTKRRPYKRMRR